MTIGLTGSIGMGKSTTAQMFRDEGLPVWSADDVVHEIYQTNRSAISQVRKLCPEAVGTEGIDRVKLSDWIKQDASHLAKLEKVIHPLVDEDRAAFLRDTDAEIVVLDIPLLFETGAYRSVDAVVVVSTTLDEQRRRVLERPNMTDEKFQLILSNQMPDEDKRRLADYVIDTSSIDSARSSVRTILKDLKKRGRHA